YDHGELPMSMSIGIAAREPGSAETLEQLIQRADHAMYHVKRNGRANWHVSQLSLTL
ncbi:MAG: diguanylate cyclase, partial [Cytophagaceae bacterium]